MLIFLFVLSLNSQTHDSNLGLITFVKPELGIVLNNNPQVYYFYDDNIGGFHGNLGVEQNDTLKLYGYLYLIDNVTNKIIPLFYIAEFEKILYCFHKKDFVDTYYNEVNLQKNEFCEIKSKDDTIWNRAKQFVNKFSEMPIIVNNNESLITQNPTDSRKIGFIIQKKEYGNQYCYNIEVNAGIQIEDDLINILEKRCSLYMQRGIIDSFFNK